MILSSFNLRQNGLDKIYKFIILAPEVHHFTMSNLLVECRKTIIDIEHVVNKVKLNNEDYFIKYRDKLQFLRFPTNHSSKIGYGNLMKYCNENTIVIGHPGSAMIECLSKNVSFFPYFDYDKCKQNSNLNTLLLDCLYVAKNKEELLDNILSNKLYKPDFSFDDLVPSKSRYLHEIVHDLLNKKD
tara:strand:- start:2477 stop:3031 length:555 start_codon:yes stop_codon:yes gene_type:complete